MRFYQFTALVALLFTSNVLSKFIAYANEDAVKDLKLPIYNRSDNDSEVSSNNMILPRRNFFKRDPDKGDLVERGICCVGPVCGPCGAAGTLKVPRAFALPTLFFKALYSVPRTLASAIPGPSSVFNTTIQRIQDGQVVERRGTCCIGAACGPCGAAGALRVPRAFALPTIFFNAIGAIPRALAAAIPAPPAIINSQQNVHQGGIVTSNTCSNCQDGNCKPCAPGEVNTPTNPDFTPDIPNPDLGWVPTPPRALPENATLLETRGWCCIGAACGPCGAAGALRIPRIFTLPALLINIASSIPKALASAIPASAKSFLDKRQKQLDESFLVKRTETDGVLQPLSGRGEQHCVDGGHGRFICSAASGLRVPRFFALPTLIFSTLSSLPGTFCAVLPAPFSFLSPRGADDQASTTISGQELPTGEIYPRADGIRFCPIWKPKCNSGSGLYPPRLIAIPALVFSAFSTFPTTLVSALPAPSSFLLARTEDNVSSDALSGQNSPELKILRRGNAYWCNKKAKICYYKQLPVHPSDIKTGSKSRPHAPRMFVLPSIIFGALSSLPRTLATATLTGQEPSTTEISPRWNPLRCRLSRCKSPFENPPRRPPHSPRDDPSQEQDSPQIYKRSNPDDFKHSQRIWSSGTTLRVPRIFSLLTALSSIPASIAAAIPTPPFTSTIQGQGSPLISISTRDDSYWCQLPYGLRHLCREKKKSSGSGIRAPRIFSLPIILLATLSSIPSALALAIPHITSSIASPDFKGVEKAVDDVKDMVFGKEKRYISTLDGRGFDNMLYLYGGSEGWEDRLGATWVVVLGMMIMFAGSL